mmetsp:Transcript_14990/g.34496  ORF Transcript_14990/g.34496 Transcript_14990/m.34496 type:complete len:279 (+) Transcript_14990:595-1431(+)
MPHLRRPAHRDLRWGFHHVRPGGRVLLGQDGHHLHPGLVLGHALHRGAGRDARARRRRLRARRPRHPGGAHGERPDPPRRAARADGLPLLPDRRGGGLLVLQRRWGVGGRRAGPLGEARRAHQPGWRPSHRGDAVVEPHQRAHRDGVGLADRRPLRQFQWPGGRRQRGADHGAERRGRSGVRVPLRPSGCVQARPGPQHRGVQEGRAEVQQGGGALRRCRRRAAAGLHLRRVLRRRQIREADRRLGSSPRAFGSRVDMGASQRCAPVLLGVAQPHPCA